MIWQKIMQEERRSARGEAQKIGSRGGAEERLKKITTSTHRLKDHPMPDAFPNNRLTNAIVIHRLMNIITLEEANTMFIRAIRASEAGIDLSFGKLLNELRA